MSSAGAVDEQGFVSVSTSANEASSIPPPSTQQQQQQQQQQQAGMATQVVDMFQRSSHPTTALFHVAFKVGAILFYLLNSMVGLSQVQLFVLVVVLMACDFWVAKNISGRLMVGLRWWNESAEDGTSTWRYESSEDQAQVTSIDYTLFWYPMYLSGVAWALFAFWALIKFDLESVLLCGVSLVLVWSNVYGFWNCSAYARDRMKTAVMSGVQQSAMAAFTSRWFSGKTADIV